MWMITVDVEGALPLLGRSFRFHDEIDLCDGRMVNVHRDEIGFMTNDDLIGTQMLRRQIKRIFHI